jgi:hypothetical protein
MKFATGKRTGLICGERGNIPGYYPGDFGIIIMRPSGDKFLKSFG